ncbi:MAG: type II toxin-antitoxin system VapC family toxin [Candidatus Competibacteraceae bacterium]
MAVLARIVPDASVILKWVLPPEHEADFEQAKAIREAYINQEIGLLVPTIWIYEAGNLLGRRYPDQADELLNTLENFDMEVIAPHPKWRQQALLLMRRHGVTFYDAAYHALAITESALLVTADVTYIHKVGYPSEIMRLSDWIEPFSTLKPTAKE